jgi:D-beta-D-heptose 7-phosphate kinase / D-beta-D-heptose 1-phosphate adenosyltransferase
MTLHVPNFSDTRILVVGDVMLDRYWHGDASRISPEAPVPVVSIKTLEERPGGAGNVGLNARSVGCNVNLLGISGDDEAADILSQRLQATGVDVNLSRYKNLSTLVKLRVLSLHQQLLRLDFEQTLHPTDLSALIKNYRTALANTDVVILSDYGKGTLRDVQTFIQLANDANIPVLVDPKSLDFNIYRGATILTPNRKEFEAVVGKCEDEQTFINKGLKLIDNFQLGALLITRGEQGMTLLRKGEPELHLPAQAREVYDVTGAGDTVISILAAVLGAGEDLQLAASLANVAAGIVVGKLGAACVSVPELRRAVQEVQSSGRGVMTEDQLKIAIEDARAHGERIVMTNGCFDILHAGHVTYLEQAKALGNRLIVAVNDDDSVVRLKGPNRPINTLNRRMAVLAGLGAVDWVVPFSEDTPERIIHHLLPDILVKGGDYEISNIVGANAVIKNGGEVKVLCFVDDCSTTEMVNRILQLNKEAI